jgi:hypothetical protein
MASHWSPDQLQFQSLPERAQPSQPAPYDSFRRFPAMGTTLLGGFPIRTVRVFPAGSALHDGFHRFSFFLAI